MSNLPCCGGGVGGGGCGVAWRGVRCFSQALGPGAPRAEPRAAVAPGHAALRTNHVLCGGGGGGGAEFSSVPDPNARGVQKCGGGGEGGTSKMFRVLGAHLNPPLHSEHFGPTYVGVHHPVYHSPSATASSARLPHNRAGCSMCGGGGCAPIRTPAVPRDVGGGAGVWRGRGRGWGPALHTTTTPPPPF